MLFYQLTETLTKKMPEEIILLEIYKHLDLEQLAEYGASLKMIELLCPFNPPKQIRQPVLNRDIVSTTHSLLSQFLSGTMQPESVTQDPGYSKPWFICIFNKPNCLIPTRPSHYFCLVLKKSPKTDTGLSVLQAPANVQSL